MVLAVLSTLRNVKLEALAHGVRMPIQANSRRKRLQRFLDLPCWDLESYVSRTDTEPGRQYLRHSYFYMGSFGATWAQAGGNIQHNLRALLRIVPNKRKLYAKGFRVMMLAQKAL
jgi:hypothetical protein